jgi:hypothetical protein
MAENPFMKLMAASLKKPLAAPAGAAPSPLAKALDTMMQPGFGEATPTVEQKNISESPVQALTKPTLDANAFSVEAATKAMQAILTPQAQQLLGGGGGGPAQGSESEDSVADRNALVPSGMGELASIDTESMDPITKRETNLNAQATQFGKRMVLDSEGSVRALCDRIDQMIQGNANLVGPALIDLRGYVQTLMVTLKSRPEFDSVVIDTDVRNVMRFIRATREEALGLREIKTVKKAVRSAKKETSSNKLKGLEGAFMAIMNGGKK